MSDFSDWVGEVTGDASIRSIARAIHKSPDSVSRWLAGAATPPGVIVQIARAYGANYVEGTIAAGIVTADDIVDAMPGVVRFARTSQLTGELHRRALSQDPALIRG